MCAHHLKLGIIMEGTSSNLIKIAAISGVAVSVGIASALFQKKYKSRCKIESEPKRWLRVGTVSKLIVYPIKSCAGIEVPELIPHTLGFRDTDCQLLRDRVFMVVDPRYAFQNQKHLPNLALITVTVNGDELTVSAPGMDPLTIIAPENIRQNKRSCRVYEDHVREVLDCGDAIGNWLDTWLQVKGFRLVYHNLEKTQRKLTAFEQKFPTFLPAHKATFQDVTSYMLMTEESVAKVNQVMTEESSAKVNELLTNSVTYRNFRPSILIQSTAEPFGEEHWRYIRIGSENGPTFLNSQPCARCRLTTINPDTAEFDNANQPLATLLSMKRSVGDKVVDDLLVGQGLLGIHLGIYREGNNIKVGDAVYAALL